MDPWSFLAIANGLLSEPSPHRMLWCWVKQVTWGNNKRLINLLNIYLLIFYQLSLDVHSLIWEDSGKKLWELNGKLSSRKIPLSENSFANDFYDDSFYDSGGKNISHS